MWTFWSGSRPVRDETHSVLITCKQRQMNENKTQSKKRRKQEKTQTQLSHHVQMCLQPHTIGIQLHTDASACKARPLKPHTHIMCVSWWLWFDQSRSIVCMCNNSHNWLFVKGDVMCEWLCKTWKELLATKRKPTWQNKNKNKTCILAIGLQLVAKTPEMTDWQHRKML